MGEGVVYSSSRKTRWRGAASGNASNAVGVMSFSVPAPSGNRRRAVSMSGYSDEPQTISLIEARPDKGGTDQAVPLGGL
jgi:hypothetical protein